MCKRIINTPVDTRERPFLYIIVSYSVTRNGMGGRVSNIQKACVGGSEREKDCERGDKKDTTVSVIILNQ